MWVVGLGYLLLPVFNFGILGFLRFGGFLVSECWLLTCAYFECWGFVVGWCVMLLICWFAFRFILL